LQLLVGFANENISTDMLEFCWCALIYN